MLTPSRTPLNTISLSIRILLENLKVLQEFHLGPTQRKESDKMSALVEECLNLIDDLDESASVAVMTLNDLINYDKIETNTFTIEEQDVNLWSVLEKTIGPFTLQAKEKHIKLNFKTQVQEVDDHVTYDLNSLRVVGDSIKLAQVVRNLISNALKFTPAEGEVKITGLNLFSVDPDLLTAAYKPTEIAVTSAHLKGHFFDLQFPDPPIGNIVITVTDSGPGLSAEQQLALFHQGVQFNPNQLQAGQGSGLGLWISKEIVSLHHGTILVTSDGLGCGSTFEVTLPVVLREDRPTVMRPIGPLQTPKASDLHSPISAKFKSRARHVLVVDDSALSRKVVCRLLKSQGFICHEAENGAECVEMVLAGKCPYELILMDFEMPVLDGPSAARQLRDDKCDLLIIGVTGNVLPEDKQYFIDHGANIVLSKPLNVSELLEMVESHERSLLSKV
jgi:signal transduction histidine kinase/ActR/RegA family two-component response regulator